MKVGFTYMLTGMEKGQEATAAGAVKKLIIKLSWPVVAEQSMATLTNIIDLMMVGRLGAAAIAAVGLSIHPLLLAQALGAAVSIGTTALVARFTGAKEADKGGETLQQSLLVSFLFSVIILSIYYLFAGELMTFLGAEPAVVLLGSSYLRLVIPGLLFMFISFIISAALRGAGDTRTPMKVNLAVNLLNVLANYTLIFGNFGAPALGLNGAAIATSLARIVGALMLIFYVFSPKSMVRLRWKGFFRADLMMIRRILKIGVPATLEQLVVRIAQILLVRVIAGLGTVAYAAHQLALNAESISYMPGFGIAVAATTLVGQNLGANRPERAEQSAYQSWKLGTMIMGLMALVFLLFPRFLLSLYTDQQEIISLGAVNLRIIAFAQIQMATQFIFAGALRGAGDTRAVFYSTALSSWICRLGMAYLFVYFLEWGLAGAWLAMVIDWTIRGSFVFFRFKQGGWKKLKI